MDFTQAGLTLALPDLAVGRLVDTASDISAAVDAYILTDGVIAPSSSLVTGYDFVGDARWRSRPRWTRAPIPRPIP